MDFRLKEKIAIVTGAGGAICGAIARGLAAEGAHVAIWDKSLDAAKTTAAAIRATGGTAVALECDVLSKEVVAQTLEETLAALGKVDILVNGAGGSRRETTTSEALKFFDIEPAAMQDVINLNYLSAVIPAQAVGRVFAAQGDGVVLNISSIGGGLPLSRALSYSNGKAATDNFTRWLAVHMAQEYDANIRVNAIAPGFMLTEQNRFLLVEQDTGELTPRGRQVVNSVPMSRLGDPSEIVGAALWLVSGSATFVTGAVIPIDGGFSAFGGV